MDRDSIVEKKVLRQKYGNLFTELERLFFEEDPMEIVYDEQFEKYSPEVTTILPRLSLEAHGEDDVRHILEEELTNWFTDLSDRERRKIQEMTPKVWMLWQTYPEFHCS